MTDRAWPIVLLAMVTAPLVTWLAHIGPRLGLPPYPPQAGMDLYPNLLLWFMLYAALAVYIGASDKWLGVTLAVIGLTLFWRGTALDPTHAVLFAAGALFLHFARHTPRAWWPTVKTLIAISGMFQAVYVLHQAWFKYDILWGPLFGGVLNAPQWIRPIGTIGTADAAGAYVAIASAFMPWWCLPIAVLAVWYTHSLGALLAFVVAMTLRYRQHWQVWLATPFLLLVGLAYRLLSLPGHEGGLKSLTPRFAVWRFGLDKALHQDPVLGWGLGGWFQQVPAHQQHDVFFPTNEIWAQAHSDPIQWVAETGAVGLILLCLWCYTHRAMFYRTSWSPAVSAAFANALVFFPMHQVALALLSIVVVALATAPDPQPAIGGSV